MSIIEEIQADLDTYIANLSVNTSVDDMMLIVAAVNDASDDRVIKLDTVNELPEAYNVPKGTIFYVQEIRTLVFALADRWLGLDGRVLRFDPFVALAWGNNNGGIIGDNTTIQRSSPVTVVGGIMSWSQVSAGRNHTVGIADKIAYFWGLRGDGAATSLSSPVTVVGGINNWKQLSAGKQFFSHTAGVTNDGNLYVWGSNGQGQIGDGTTIIKSSPVTVVGGINGWSYVGAGYSHTIGIANGIAYAWGNNNGRLGDGTTLNRSSPVTVVGGITNWKHVSTNMTHNLGVTSYGNVYCWGSNSYGQLGDGTIVTRSSPVTIVGGITNWKQVSAGGDHSLGVTEDGIAYAWGINGGRIGDGFIVNRSSPVTVVGGITNWAQVSAGFNSSAGISNGVLYAWGTNISNGAGNLGNNTALNTSSPVTVVGGISTWTQVSVGSYHTIALKTD